jgi:hypothetical protein
VFVLLCSCASYRLPINKRSFFYTEYTNTKRDEAQRLDEDRPAVKCMVMCEGLMGMFLTDVRA